MEINLFKEENSMFNGTEMTMPVVPAGYGNGSNGMFGNDGWWAIILFAMIFGWGGNGFGFGGSRDVNGFTDSAIQRGFDNQSVLNKLNGIENGLCDGFYAQNTTMLNGFNGVQRDLCTGFNAVTSAIAQSRFDTQNCCCETNRNIDSVRFENAQNTCAITNAIHAEGEQTRALINANTMQDLRDKLAEKDRDVLARDFKLSQLNQNAFISATSDAGVAEIIRRTGHDCPQPSYVVQPPQPVAFPTNCCGNVNYAGYGNYCGCGNNSGCGCC